MEPASIVGRKNPVFSPGETQDVCTGGEGTDEPPGAQALFQQLKEAVLSKKPILRRILQVSGAKRLFDYAREYLRPPAGAFRERQEEFLGTFHSFVAERLGEEAARSGTEQLRDCFVVSTADHHGPICHPFFVNSNLLIAAPFAEHGSAKMKNVIVLACANVSQNNSSYPRGLQFHSATGGGATIVNVPFFPASTRLCPVVHFRPYTAHDLDKACRGLREKVRDGVVLQDECEVVQRIIRRIYGDPAVLRARSYSDQITMTNYALWKEFFPGEASFPHLLYLEIEGLVSRLLLDHHLQRPQSAVYQLLFSPESEESIRRSFDGISGAFSTAEGWGTYLFWAIPRGAKYRQQMRKEGGELVSEDGSCRVPLMPAAIGAALADGTLIPGTLLNYSVLAFYYGLTCLGGFSQVNYLTFMRDAHAALLTEQGNAADAVACASVETGLLVGDVTIAFLADTKGALHPATGVDLLMRGFSQSWQCIVEQSKRVTLEEGLSPLMPEMYRIVTPEDERQLSLLTISPEQVSRIVGIDRLVDACASLSTLHSCL